MILRKRSAFHLAVFALDSEDDTNCNCPTLSPVTEGMIACFTWCFRLSLRSACLRVAFLVNILPSTEGRSHLNVGNWLFLRKLGSVNPRLKISGR